MTNVICFWGFDFTLYSVISFQFTFKKINYHPEIFVTLPSPLFFPFYNHQEWLTDLMHTFSTHPFCFCLLRRCSTVTICTWSLPSPTLCMAWVCRWRCSMGGTFGRTDHGLSTSTLPPTSSCTLSSSRSSRPTTTELHSCVSIFCPDSTTSLNLRINDNCSKDIYQPTKGRNGKKPSFGEWGEELVVFWVVGNGLVELKRLQTRLGTSCLGHRRRCTCWHDDCVRCADALLQPWRVRKFSNRSLGEKIFGRRFARIYLFAYLIVDFAHLPPNRCLTHQSNPNRTIRKG